MTKITPVILSGGAGTRLWPMSNAACPKQFLPLTQTQTMFQMTLQRANDPQHFDTPLIVANAAHQALIRQQLSEIDADNARLLLEPCARNTAPAIALAALACKDPESPMLVMPSDHVVTDDAAFHGAIMAALPLVQGGYLATFGITPTGPETGYGYIRMGGEVGDKVHAVDRFIEKPPLAKAQEMLAKGGHAWNGGIFLFRADAYLAALLKYAPEILSAAQKATDAAQIDGDSILPDGAQFAACPSDSIDYAVMEKAAGEEGGKVAVVPVSMGWSDVGSWDALQEIAPANEAINDIDGAGNYVKSDGVRIHLAGVKDMIVVAAGDDVVILPRGQSQDVKKIVEAIKKAPKTP